jgi:Protein of unknown function (DUF3592)
MAMLALTLRITNMAREYVALERDVARFFLVIGLALSVIAAFVAYDTASFVERAVLAHGEVVAIEQVPGGRGGSAMSPIVKYTGEQGEQRTFRPRGTVSRALTPSVIGETVDLLYDGANPVDVRLASVWDLYLLSIVLGGIALLLFCWTAWTLMRMPGQ